MTNHTFQIGDRVQGGEGDDFDTGIIIDFIDPPQGECDVMVAWDSGVRAPAKLSDLQ